VTERKNVLSALFYLLALRTLIDVQAAPLGNVPKEDARRYWLRYALGFACFVAALLCKSVTCSMPAVLLLLTWWKAGLPKLRETWPLITLFLVGAVFAWNTNWLERNHVGAAGSTFAWTAAERLLIAGRAVWFYALELVWPVNLSFMYARWQVRTDSWWQWLVALSAFAIPAVIGACYRRMTGPLIALLYFGGTLFPALGFFNVFPMRYSFVADHFQYLASLGILALIAAWWMHPRTPADPKNQWARRLPTVSMNSRVAVAGVALLALAIVTWQRQSAFCDSNALWSDVIQKNPTSMAANIQLGRLASRKREFAVAERYFRDGLRYRTDDLETHEFETNLAHALSGQGRVEEAAVEFREALARKPDYPEALNGLANVEAQQGRFSSAVELFHRALATQPGNPIIHANLGNALAASGLLAEGEKEYRLSLELDPSATKPRLDLSKALARQGRFREAEEECLKVLQLDSRLVAANRLLVRIRRDRQRTEVPSERNQGSP
jgi:Flp pilus assembly protein TadD